VNGRSRWRDQWDRSSIRPGVMSDPNPRRAPCAHVEEHCVQWLVSSYSSIHPNDRSATGLPRHDSSSIVSRALDHPHGNSTLHFPTSWSPFPSPSHPLPSPSPSPIEHAPCVAGRCQVTKPSHATPMSSRPPRPAPAHSQNSKWSPLDDRKKKKERKKEKREKTQKEINHLSPSLSLPPSRFFPLSPRPTPPPQLIPISGLWRNSRLSGPTTYCSVLDRSRDRVYRGVHCMKRGVGWD
jgi:hypothetical protein